jgi:hypothetical protein
MLTTDTYHPSPNSSNMPKIMFSNSGSVLIHPTSSSVESSVVVERELTLDAKLSSMVKKYVEHNRSGHSIDSSSYVETGMAVARMPSNRWFNSRMRIRQGVRTEVTVKHSITSKQVAPGIKYSVNVEEVVDESSDIVVRDRFDAYKTNVELKFLRIGDWFVRLRHYTVTNGVSCEIEYAHDRDPTDDELIDLLSLIYTRVINFDDIIPYIDRGFMASLQQSAMGSKQVRNVSSQNMKYRVKVDGEHVWIVDGGSVWFICRFNKSLDVLSYITKSLIGQYERQPTVIRAELLPMGDMYLIDVLSFNSMVSPISRTIEHSMSIMQLINDPPPRLYIRQDYDNIELALESSRQGDIPNDGVIAINEYNSLTYKIKPTSTVDLLCKSSKLHCIRPGHGLSSVGKSLPGMQDGVVYDCSISYITIDGVNHPYVSDYRMRSDKSVPNTSDKYNALIDLYMHDSDSIDYVMREVSAFSFEVRKLLYSKALSSRTTGRLVIDIGTGRLQSSTVMELNDNSTSWLMVDPNIEITRRVYLATKAVNATMYDSESLVNLISDLNSGKTRVAYIRRQWCDILSMSDVVNKIVTCMCPIVYSFSASYCQGDILMLSKHRIPQFASYYSYSALTSGSTVFDIGPMSMCINVDNATGTFTMKNKVTYVEPLIFTSSLHTLSVTRACDMITTANEVSDVTRKVIDNILIAM